MSRRDEQTAKLQARAERAGVYRLRCRRVDLEERAKDLRELLRQRQFFQEEYDVLVTEAVKVRDELRSVKQRLGRMKE